MFHFPRVFVLVMVVYGLVRENVVAQDVPFPRRSVLLVSQATGNLSDFAEVSARINAAYARRHGYGFVVARGDASDWVQDRDVRWSKVAILRDIAVNARFTGRSEMVGTRRAEGRGAGELGQLGDARDYDARYALVVPPNASQDLTRPSLPRLLVFIDADAVVSNFEQTFDWRHFSRQSKTIARHAQHQRQGGGGTEDEELHMLMCEEGDGGSVANTGVIIARDTPETQQVLQRWWAVGEEEAATLYGRRHEQSALDILLATHPHITPRIGIAPVALFNTAPPFYKTHSTSSFILHLMYEPYGGLRRNIFTQMEASIRVDGRIDAKKMQDLVTKLARVAEAAYAKEMEESTGDEDLAVMYAQLLWSVYGRPRARQALDLYAKAVQIAPHDPDTHRILAEMTIEVLEDSKGGDVAGLHLPTAWCGVVRSLETSLKLETNPARLPSVKGLVEVARSKCVALASAERKSSTHSSTTHHSAIKNSEWHHLNLWLEHHGWTPLVILGVVVGLVMMILAPICCIVLSARVKDKYD